MLLRPAFARRRGASAVLTLFMLLPLLLVVAFALDLNYIWRTDGELQDAADAAALAGTSQLVVPAHAAPSGLNPVLLAQLQQSASANATSTAQAYAQMHSAGGVPVVVNSADVEVGYVEDPAAKDNTVQGQFQIGAPNFPNSVRVRVRRDATVSTGPLPLFFGGMFGTPTSNRQATAVATLRSQNITGFNGTGSKLLPLAIDQATYNWLRGLGPAPAGAVSQDLYTVRSPLESKLTIPLNIVKAPDGIPEAQIFPNSCTPGNFGLVALRNGKTTATPDYSNWIQYGPSSADLASFGPNGLQLSPSAPLTLYGGPGMKTSLDADFRAIVGQPRSLIVYSSVSGNGANTQYQAISVAGATVVAVDLLAPNPYVTVQLSLTMDLTATRLTAPAGSANFVYTGISLSR